MSSIIYIFNVYKSFYVCIIVLERCSVKLTNIAKNGQFIITQIKRAKGLLDFIENIRKGGNHMLIRTIEKAYEELKARDPNTCISKKYVRDLVNNGVIPSTKSGNRRLVDVDVIEDYIAERTGVKERETKTVQ